MKLATSLLVLAALSGCGGDSYVLVHGAWMGAWSWDSVAQGLRERGNTVSVVELPSHGQDQTPVSGASLDAYVTAAVGAIEAQKRPVVLVGHSMGGAVITQTAERVPEKISRLVYLAGYMPANGQSLLDLAMTDGDSHAGAVLQIDGDHGTGAIPMGSLQDVFCADCSTDGVSNLQSKYRDEPLSPLGTPLSTTAQGWGSVPKFYVYTQQDHAVSYPLQQRMTEGVTLAGSVTLDASHSPQLSRPTEVLDALASFER
ncbi:MAG TPA: alpha/beta fold hydrolase [Myxococcaceae bacterium]|jgi:pimeloyl-ACP methyl ester carboxylesterase